MENLSLKNYFGKGTKIGTLVSEQYKMNHSLGLMEITPAYTDYAEIITKEEPVDVFIAPLVKLGSTNGIEPNTRLIKLLFEQKENIRDAVVSQDYAVDILVSYDEFTDRTYYELVVLFSDWDSAYKVALERDFGYWYRLGWLGRIDSETHSTFVAPADYEEIYGDPLRRIDL